MNELKLFLTISDLKVAKLYSLPEIDKTNVLSSPVISAIGTPWYKLSKFSVNYYLKFNVRKPIVIRTAHVVQKLIF